MAPGGRSRQRSSVLPTPPPLVQSDTTMAQTTLPTVSRPAELSIPDTVGINNAPSIIKKGRGKAVGNVLEKATRGVRRVPVTIPNGKFKPVGDWAAAFTSEVGVICRQWAPLTAKNWGEIKDEDKKVLYQRILDKFEIDLSRPNVKHTVDTMLKNRHKNWRHKLYKFYKEFPPQEASQHLPEDVKQNDWDHLCERFSNDKFQERSKTNLKNRKNLKVNHSGGSKSFIRHRYDRRDPVTKEEPNRIELYYHTHYKSKTKSWTTPEAQQTYEKMKSLQSQPGPDGVPLTADEICDQVLRIKIPSSTRGQGLQSQLKEATQRAEEAEKRSEQLAERVEAQENEIATQKMDIESQKTQLVTQRTEIDDMRSRQAITEALVQSLLQCSQSSNNTILN